MTLTAAAALLIAAGIAYFSNPLAAWLSFAAAVGMVATYVAHKRQPFIAPGPRQRKGLAWRTSALWLKSRRSAENDAIVAAVVPGLEADGHG
ncbi:hypothetical protein NtRootA4_31960 [Arthrobacter sp. NtRootA4]|nr:hypothetical protein NtRootA4_31960 [Arthrobacter sp. NtRootA4]BCW24549.1 hypothetical protein NtRootC7_34160 [Arthrobacter sp. NtRootC7]BCW33089.1 hypothetical protein NtRootD5_34200 [Arthrobacter sp. NtRootD5]